MYERHCATRALFPCHFVSLLALFAVVIRMLISCIFIVLDVSITKIPDIKLFNPPAASPRQIHGSYCCG